MPDGELRGPNGVYMYKHRAGIACHKKTGYHMEFDLQLSLRLNPNTVSPHPAPPSQLCSFPVHATPHT
jgi:hypothetical protein